MRPEKCRGFNLVEAAIVLGVIGLVIGGIWIAASQVSENMTASELSKGFLSAMTEIENKVPSHVVTGSGVTLQFGASVTVAAKMGLFPKNWVRGDDAIILPTGQAVEVNAVTGASGPAAAISFNAGPTSKFSPALCINVVSKMILGRKDTFVQVNGIWIVTHDMVNGACTANGSVSIASLMFTVPLTLR